MKTYMFWDLEFIRSYLAEHGFHNIECVNADTFDWTRIQPMDAVIGNNLNAAQIISVCARGGSYYELILNSDGSVKNLTQLSLGDPNAFSGEIQDFSECCDKYTFARRIPDRSSVKGRLLSAGICLTLHSADGEDDLEAVVEHLAPSVGNPPKWRVRFGRTLEDFNYVDIGDVEISGDSLEVVKDD